MARTSNYGRVNAPIIGRTSPTADDLPRPGGIIPRHPNTRGHRLGEWRETNSGTKELTYYATLNARILQYSAYRIRLNGVRDCAQFDDFRHTH